MRASPTANAAAGRSPQVSVIMTTFNNAPYVAAAISSILAQSYGDFELILMDDGSSDDTVRICRDFAAQDCRIRFSAHANAGGFGAGAQNRAMDLCQGQFIAHLDADDLWLPNKLQLQLARMQQPHAYACTFTHAAFIDAQGHRRPPTSAECFLGHYSGRSLALRLLMGNFLCHASAIYRRAQMALTGRFSMRFVRVCDYDYWLRMLAHTDAEIIPEVTVLYRVHSDNVSLSNAQAAADHSWQVALRHLPAIHRRHKLTGEEHLLILQAIATTAWRAQRWQQAYRLMQTCERIAPGWIHADPMWASYHQRFSGAADTHSHVDAAACS